MKSYYYHNGTDKVGPLTIEELKKHNLTRDSYVWHDGLTDWKRAAEIPELANILPTAPKAGAPQAQQQAYPQQPAQQQQGYGYQQQQYQQPYQQPYQQRNYATGGTVSAIPNMGALKAFSIIGLIFSLILFIIGIGVFNISGYCYDYYDNCSCYGDSDEQEIFGAITIILSLIFLTQSIITATKAFKNYGSATTA